MVAAFRGLVCAGCSGRVVRLFSVCRVGQALLRSADSGLRCLALLIWTDVISLCARTRGEPSSAHCEQRLSERLTPCPCEPVYACTGMRGHTEKGTSWQTRRKNDAPKEQEATRIAVSDPTRSAASRAGMAGWAGEGGGRFGERREYEAPTIPSTHRQHGMARHYTCQPRNSTQQQKPIEKRQVNPARLATRTAAPGHSRMTDAAGCVNIVS